MKNVGIKRAQNRANNLIVGGGVTLFFAALIGYGLCVRPNDGASKTNKTTESKKETIMEVTITKENFETEVLKADQPVLVDFWATWCGPCRMQAPVLAEVANDKGDKIKVGKVNVDDEPALAARYGVYSIPTMLLFSHGEVVETLVGFHSKPELESFLDTHVP